MRIKLTVVFLCEGEDKWLIAVADDFYGWGIRARLENLEGISIE